MLLEKELEKVVKSELVKVYKSGFDTFLSSSRNIINVFYAYGKKKLKGKDKDFFSKNTFEFVFCVKIGDKKYFSIIPVSYNDFNGFYKFALEQVAKQYEITIK